MWVDYLAVDTAWVRCLPGALKTACLTVSLFVCSVPGVQQQLCVQSVKSLPALGLPVFDRRSCCVVLMKPKPVKASSHAVMKGRPVPGMIGHAACTICKMCTPRLLPTRSVSVADSMPASSLWVKPLGNFQTSRKASPMFLLGLPPCNATCSHSSRTSVGVSCKNQAVW